MGKLDSLEYGARRNVVITGFGLFRDHLVNPSWEAIKDNSLKIDRSNVNIITKQISVAYGEVDRVVSELWEEYNPLLMVHIGLAAHESCIRIEQSARTGPYLHDDVLKDAPHKHLRVYSPDSRKDDPPYPYTCRPCEFASRSTCIDVDKICEGMTEALREGRVCIPTKKSNDAGLYVCEYIYQKSLSICDRSVFIHIPGTERFKLEDIRASLKIIVEMLIDDLYS